MRVTVIDYRAGNLTSVVKALRALGADVVVADDAGPVQHAERIVLPGVGHFAATRRLEETGIRDAVADAIARRVPFLGICVGLQWLALQPGQESAARGMEFSFDSRGVPAAGGG
jgi:glutamine amidotransferase